jgi:hypothetical protein
MRISSLVTAVAFGALFSSAAFALDAAQSTPAADAGAKAAKSTDCYRQADAKDLHGKDRKKFHHECMKAE